MIKDTLYADYMKEREAAEILEGESGFIVYKIVGPECFIHTMYVRPECRIQGQARQLINQLSVIALEQGCKALSANIHLTDKGASNTLLASLLVGFELNIADHGILLISKKIGEV